MAARLGLEVLIHSHGVFGSEGLAGRCGCGYRVCVERRLASPSQRPYGKEGGNAGRPCKTGIPSLGGMASVVAAPSLGSRESRMGLKRWPPSLPITVSASPWCVEVFMRKRCVHSMYGSKANGSLMLVNFGRGAVVGEIVA